MHPAAAQGTVALQGFQTFRASSPSNIFPFYYRSGSMQPGSSLAGLFTSVLTGYAVMFSDG